MKRLLAVLAILLSLSLIACLILIPARNGRIPKPHIVSKHQWGSLEYGDFYKNQPYDPRSQGPLGDPVAITIHHSYRPSGINPPDSAIDRIKLQEIQLLHVSRGWGDIGYHFLIGSDGAIYEGRPLKYAGTHVRPNKRNIGINVIGNFQDKDYPSEAQLASLAGLISWLCDRYDIDPTAKITLLGQTNFAACGHRDWSKTSPSLCPGDRLYAYIPSLRDKVRSELLTHTSAFDARIAVTQHLPETLLAGRQYEFPFAVRNTGYIAWSHFNKIRLETQTPRILKAINPELREGETVNPLSNRAWQVKIIAPSSPGRHRLELRMADSHGLFGSKIAWDVDILGQKDSISEWLAVGPFPAHTPEEARTTDFLGIKPLDMFDAADDASLSTHDFNATGESDFVEERVRDERGREYKTFKDWYVEKESLRMSLGDHKGGGIILRRLADQPVGIQAVDVLADGKWTPVWKPPKAERPPSLKDLTIMIPGRFARGNSIRLRVTTRDTMPGKYSRLEYTLADSGEILASPATGYKAGKYIWKRLESDKGFGDLSPVLGNTEIGVVYLATYVKSPVTKQVELRTGYGGYQKAWLNGKLVLSDKPDAANFPDTMRRKVLLKKGWNRLLLKLIVEPETGKELYTRFSDSNGTPVKGLEYSVNPPNGNAGRSGGLK